LEGGFAQSKSTGVYQVNSANPEKLKTSKLGTGYEWKVTGRQKGGGKNGY